MKKFVFVLLLTFSLVSVAGTAYAMDFTVSSTLTGTQSNVDILFSFLDEQYLFKDYVVFANGTNADYYLVYGDLDFTATKVTGSDVSYIRYFNSGSGMSAAYHVTTGDWVTFNLINNNGYILCGSGAGYSSWDGIGQAQANYLLHWGLIILIAGVFILVFCRMVQKYA